MIGNDDLQFRQTLALAGIFQACTLVKQTAIKGRRESPARAALLTSIFKINADTVEDVFGTIENLDVGLGALRDQLGGAASERDFDVARYSAQIIALQKKLMRNDSALLAISNGISKVEQQRDAYGLQHVNTIAGLAEIYSSNISNLTPRIMVKGEPVHLADNDTAACIRALLLAGIRAAFLWRQSGGSRWQLLLKRKLYVSCATEILEAINSTD